jgi:hypothetical protein
MVKLLQARYLTRADLTQREIFFLLYSTPPGDMALELAG